MQLKQITYFLSVAKCLNFTAAADECAVSQPALSKAIQKLEDDLGGALLERDTQHVKLTEFGRSMRIHFERIEDNVRKAHAAARDAFAGQSTQLDVGVMCTIGPQKFARFLGLFSAQHPATRMVLHDVVPDAIPNLLLSGGLDAVFCARSAKHDLRFMSIDLCSEHLCVAFAAGHRFGSFDTVPLIEIAKERYIDRLMCEFRDEFLELTKSSGLDLNVTVSSEREDWVLEMIKADHGVSVLPSSSADLSKVEHRPVRELSHRRRLELVMTEAASRSNPNLWLAEAAKKFTWA